MNSETGLTPQPICPLKKTRPAIPSSSALTGCKRKVAAVSRHQAQAVSQPGHVRVDREPRRVEPRAEDHIRRLAADAGDLDHFFHRPWHLAAEQLDERAARRDDALGLKAKEAGRLDELFDLRRVGGREVLGRRVTPEQLRGDEVDRAVGRLRGKDRRDEELERVLMAQLGLRLVEIAQALDRQQGSLLGPARRPRRHPRRLAPGTCFRFRSRQAACAPPPRSGFRRRVRRGERSPPS